MLYSAAQPTLPGGHAKWVGVPHGAATVSGERSGFRAPNFGAATVLVTSMGRCRHFVLIRKSGYLASGLVLFCTLRLIAAGGFGA